VTLHTDPTWAKKGAITGRRQSYGRLGLVSDRAKRARCSVPVAASMHRISQSEISFPAKTPGQGGKAKPMKRTTEKIPAKPPLRSLGSDGVRGWESPNFSGQSILCWHLSMINHESVERTFDWRQFQPELFFDGCEN
jgi:hypothetical protein